MCEEQYQQDHGFSKIISKVYKLPEWEEVSLVLERLKSLVDKEVPKHPIKISSQYMYHFKCTTCGRDSIYATKNPRCMYCGQALDWESYEEDK